MMTYRIPACPADPPTPVQKARVEVAGPIQHVDVGYNIEHQIDPLHDCLSVKQLHNVLAAYPPACNSIEHDTDARCIVQHRPRVCHSIDASLWWSDFNTS